MDATDFAVSEAIWRQFAWDTNFLSDDEWHDLLVLAEFIASLRNVGMEEAGLIAFAYDMLAYYEEHHIDPEQEEGWPSIPALEEFII